MEPIGTYGIVVAALVYKWSRRRRKLKAPQSAFIRANIRNSITAAMEERGEAPRAIVIHLLALPNEWTRNDVVVFFNTELEELGYNDRARRVKDSPSRPGHEVIITK